MNIITLAIIGDLCSGKKTAAEYFIKNCGYEPIQTADYMTKIKTENIEKQLNSINLKNEFDKEDSDDNQIYGNSINLSVPKNSIKLGKLKSKIKESGAYKIVIYPNMSWDDYEELRNKTSLRIINIYSTTKKRYSNFLKKYPDSKFEDFLEMDAEISKNKLFHKLKMKAFFHINNDEDIKELTTKLSKLEGVFFKNFRPKWDDYFMKVAHILADRSNCIKQKVGAVLVRDNRIVSTGYNGTPNAVPNCFEGGCKRCNDINISQGNSLENCFCLHAEENAVTSYIN